MKVHLQRTAGFLLTLVLCAGLLLVPAFATEQVTSTGTIWSYLAQQSPDWLGTVIGTFYASACPTSPDNLHHGKILREADKRNEYWALCDYCSIEFPAHASDLDNAYKAHVTNIQNNYGTTAVGTKGILYPLTPSGKFVSGGLVSSSLCSADKGFSYGTFKSSSSSRQTTTGSEFVLPNTSAIIASPGYLSGVIECYSPDFELVGPSSSEPVPYLAVAFDQPNGQRVYYASFRDNPQVVTSSIKFYSIRIFAGINPPPSTLYSFYFRAWLCFKPYEYDVNSFTQNIGGENSRVGKFSGNFGYYGDNGQLITADNVSIVNEGDKTFYNPATGQTIPIIDWSYDYGDRSYSLSLEGDLSAEVVFGDENVTIKEGDTTYNIYYITPGGTPGPTPTPGPTSTPGPTCKHSYQEEITKVPTCTAVGTLTKTCTLCGDTKTEQIPATGHKWEVRETVNTEYDETGQLIKEGYTIYKCSVCGQEYKDSQGTGPPDEGETSGFLAWLLDMLRRTFGPFLDALLRVFDEIPKMFGNFTDFLRVTFSFFPPEVVTILIFGIIAMVVVALVKLFIK